MGRTFGRVLGLVFPPGLNPPPPPLGRSITPGNVEGRSGLGRTFGRVLGLVLPPGLNPPPPPLGRSITPGNVEGRPGLGRTLGRVLGLKVPPPPPGISGRDGRTEGRVIDGGTGRFPDSGRVEGLVLGLVAGRVEGRVLGLVAGRVEGRVLGLVAGRVEGRVLGLVAGRVEGRVLGLVAGRVEGRVLGLVGTFGLCDGCIVGRLGAFTLPRLPEKLGLVRALEERAFELLGSLTPAPECPPALPLAAENLPADLFCAKTSEPSRNAITTKATKTITNRFIIILSFSIASRFSTNTNNLKTKII